MLLQSVAVSYFTTQRLVYINYTASQLAPDVSLLGPGIVDLTPHAHEVESLEQDARNMHRRVNNTFQYLLKGLNYR